MAFFLPAARRLCRRLIWSSFWKFRPSPDPAGGSVILANLPQALHCRIGSELGLEACQRIKAWRNSPDGTCPTPLHTAGPQPASRPELPGLTSSSKMSVAWVLPTTIIRSRWRMAKPSPPACCVPISTNMPVLNLVEAFQAAGQIHRVPSTV